MDRIEWTRLLVEEGGGLARSLAQEVEDGEGGAVTLLAPPRWELVMLKVRETAQETPFYLGEALMTTCKVEVAGTLGFGALLGDAEQGAYDLALVDAVLSGPQAQRYLERWEPRFEEARRALEREEQLQAQRIALTRVDFETIEA